MWIRWIRIKIRIQIRIRNTGWQATVSLTTDMCYQKAHLQEFVRSSRTNHLDNDSGPFKGNKLGFRSNFLLINMHAAALLSYGAQVLRIN